jgi:hypothetical protein
MICGDDLVEVFCSICAKPLWVKRMLVDDNPEENDFRCDQCDSDH